MVITIQVIISGRLHNITAFFFNEKFHSGKGFVYQIKTYGINLYIFQRYGRIMINKNRVRMKKF